MNKIILLPIPKKIVWNDGIFETERKVVSEIDTAFCEDFSHVKNELALFMDTNETGNENAARIVFIKKSDFEQEEYEIVVKTNKIIIYSSSDEGAFRAVTTLKQIHKQAHNIPCLSIWDKPDYKNRASMCDFRSKIPTLDTLKETVRMLADMKYNQFQLYFESFAFYYSNFPEFYGDEKVLTPDDIRALDEYCKSLYIELVPAQASFGHMSKWLARPELSHLGCTEPRSSSLNPLDPESIKVVEKIYDCILPCFSSDKVNICCDEVGELGKGKTEKAALEYGSGKLFMDFLNKIAELVKTKYGKKIMFWSDMINHNSDLWKYIPEGSTALLWGYNSWYMRFDKFSSLLQKSGIDYYVCPGTSNWGSFTGRTTNALYNIRRASDAGKEYGASGILITDWGNSGNPQFESISYFGYAVGASYSWNNTPSVIDYDETRSKLSLHDSWKHSYILHINHYNSIHYLDRVIFNCANANLGDILYRMGNYIYLESEDIGDSTRCFELYSLGFGKEGYNMQKGYMMEIDPVYYTNIEKYMYSIMEELEGAVPGDELTSLRIKEMICNCRMTYLLARGLYVQYYYYNDRIDKDVLKKAHDTANMLYEMIEEFKELWVKRSYPTFMSEAIGHFTRLAVSLKSLEESK